MKVTKEYHVATDVVKFKRKNYSNGYWWERNYDKNGNEETYKDSNGFYKVKDKVVTKEEFEAFVNPKPLTAKQKAQAYIYLFGEDEAFFKVEEIIKGMGNNVKYKHLLEVLEEIKKY